MAAAPTPRRLCLLLNARAAADAAIRQAAEELRRRGHTVDARDLAGAGDAERLAADAARAGFDGVIAAGGDGTLNEAVNGVMQAEGGRCAVGVLPSGTANDFAAGCGFAEMAPADLLALAAEGAPTPIDVGRANGRLFVNVASGGFGAEVTASTPQVLKSLLGGLAYTLTGVVKAVAADQRQVRLRGPGWEWAGPLLFLAVGNGRLAGGGYEVAPRARLDDGLLDVAVIPDRGLRDLAAVAAELFRGHLLNLEQVEYAQLPWVEAEADHDLDVNVDGEPLAARRFRFEVLPRRVPFYLPRGWDAGPGPAPK